MLRFAMTLIAAGLPALAVAQDAEVGRSLFRTHCATCHGLEARGNGPMAGVLLIPPANLTELAAGNGGAFPTERVVKRIDGRDPLVSHGSPMPVYGDYFEGVANAAVKNAAGQPVIVSQPVADLVAYLLEIQEPE